VGILDIFGKEKGRIAGQIVLRGLPVLKMYSVSVTFFKVGSATSPAPFDGDPPTEEWTDTESVKEAEDPDTKPLRFHAERACGFYYLGIGVVAYLERGGKMFAQVERFFPMTQTFEIQLKAEQQLELAIAWPDVPFDELHQYGTIHPKPR
jgi:hypothetical protein